MDVTRKSARKWIDSLSLRVQQALFAAATYLILLAICLLAISPEQYDLSVGDVAPKTITASKDIVDELTTERRRQAAADAVSPVYYKDDTVSDTVLSDMDAVFSELRAVRELGAQIRNAWGDEGGSFTEADYAQASGLVTRLSLSNYQLRTLMNTGESDFESLYQSLVSATRTTLVSTITEGQINDAINNIQQIVSYNTRTDLWYNVAIPTLRASLKANMLIDQAATEENRQKACDAVEPTVYKQDQNIVVKGDRVTAEQIAVLESLGLLEGNSFDYPLYGQSELVYALTGLLKPDSGKIFLNNRDITHMSIRKRNEAGLSHIPEDRHKHGLVLDYSLENNLVLKSYFHPEFQRNGFLQFGEIRKYADDLIERFDVRSGQGAVTKARSMSGGNQQKAIIAREVDLSSDLLIAVQPTRGLDVGAIEYIRKELLAQRDAGKAVLLVSIRVIRPPKSWGFTWRARSATLDRRKAKWKTKRASWAAVWQAPKRFCRWRPR